MSEFNPTGHMIKVQGGADYLPVAPRLQWLRKEHPDASVETQIVDIDEQTVTFKAVIGLPTGARATGHASELRSGGSGAARYKPLETCETSAIGRALAILGFGTLDAQDDAAASGERIVDSPVARPNGAAPRSETATEKQIGMLSGLLAKAGVVPDKWLSTRYPEGLTKAQASDLIKAAQAGNLDVGEEAPPTPRPLARTGDRRAGGPSSGTGRTSLASKRSWM